MIRHFAFLGVLASAVLLLAGCPAASTTQEFFLTCKIDGIELSLSAGPSGDAPAPGGAGNVALEGIPTGFIDYFTPTNTIVLASTATIDMTGGPSFPSQQGAFTCALYGLTGTGSFTIPSDGSGGFMRFNTPDGFTIYNSFGATMNGSITKFESVGGVIEGTFSGSMKDGSGASHAITEGSFRVKIYNPFYYQPS
jgi:hypothetical protein